MKKTIAVLLLILISITLSGCIKKAVPINETIAEEEKTGQATTEEEIEALPEEETHEESEPEGVGEQEEAEEELEETTKPEEEVIEEEEEEVGDKEPVKDYDNCQSLLNDVCECLSGMQCIGKSTFDKSARTLSFSAENNFEYSVSLIGFSSYVDNTYEPCLTNCDIKSVKISIEGTDFSTLHYQILEAGDVFEIMVECNQDMDYINQKFKLEYSCIGENECSGEVYFMIQSLG